MYIRRDHSLIIRCKIAPNPSQLELDNLWPTIRGVNYLLQCLMVPVNLRVCVLEL